MNISLLTRSNVVSVTVLLAFITATYITFSSDENNTTPLLGESDLTQNTSILKTGNPKKVEKTIGTVWQWEGSLISPSEMSSDAHEIIETKSFSLFSEETVFNALRRVRVDNQNNIIVDHETLIALNETLNDSRVYLDDQALSDLQTIIKRGLPGDVGDEVARIAGNYYHLLEASREFNAVYEAGSSAALDIERTIEEHEENYSELMALRELYLGADVASRLFSTSNANANYMFDMFKLAQDTQLSEQEKEQRRTEITERNAEQTIDIRDWNERHQAFLVDKENILIASINDEEKRAQLIELTYQHFDLEELAHVGHMQLDKL